MKISKEAKQNRSAWDSHSEKYQSRHGKQLGRDELVWGVWSIPESKLKVLGNLKNKKVLELGCGAAQNSISVALAGGKPVGIDNSPKQLEHAKSNLKKRGLDFPLYVSSAEKLPFKAKEFDIVFCDHGAMTFSPTESTLKEVFRVLKKRGLFAFNIQSPLHEVCHNEKTNKVGSTLRKNYFELERYVDEGIVCFQHPYGQWIRFIVDAGFTIIDLIEPKPTTGAKSTYNYVSVEWARQWPAESIWKLRK